MGCEPNPPSPNAITKNSNETTLPSDTVSPTTEVRTDGTGSEQVASPSSTPENASPDGSTTIPAASDVPAVPESNGAAQVAVENEANSNGSPNGETSTANGSTEAKTESETAEQPVVSTTRTSTIVPPSRAYLPPNRNTAPPPPLPAPKSEKELAEEKKTREAAKKRGEITFDALVFDMEKGGEFKPEMLGPDNWDLNEKTWKLRGFILPTTLFSQTGITEFVLVRDNQECCFGPGAALFDCVIVTMEPGKSISYTTRVVTVKGKLEIDTESFRYPDDEGHYAVYKMTAEEVK